MAEFGRRMSFSAKANADLTGKQYHIVRFAGANLVDQASHAAAAFSVGAVGVLQNKPNSDEAAEVAYFGESKVTAGAAVTAGRMITTNSSGRAINASSGEIIVGRALDAAGADGEFFRALLFPAVRLSGAV